MSLVDLRGMPGPLVAAMADAVAEEPRILRFRLLLQDAEPVDDLTPIPMKEHGAATMSLQQFKDRLEETRHG